MYNKYSSRLFLICNQPNINVLCVCDAGHEIPLGQVKNNV